MFEQPDVSTGSAGRKAYWLTVEVLLKLSVRHVVSRDHGCIFHFHVVGHFLHIVNLKCYPILEFALFCVFVRNRVSVIVTGFFFVVDIS